MRTYVYTLKCNHNANSVTFKGTATNFQQMLARIERERNLEDWRVTEIREVRK